MFAALLIAILATLALSESAALISSPWRVVLETVVLGGGVSFFPLCAGSLLLQRIESQGYDDRCRRWLRLYRMGAPLWAAVLGPAVIQLTNWPTAVRMLVADGWLLDELLILAPVLAPFVLISWATAGIEQRLMLLRDGAAPSRKALFGLQLRHYGGFLLAPVFFALAVGEFADRFEQQLQGKEWLLPIVMLMGLVVLFPFVLRRVWETEPMAAGPLRSRLEAASRRVGLRVREILVWKTHGCMVNAAIVGFSGLARYLLLTDELIAQFDDDEIEAVLLHEAAHVRRRHLLLRFGLIGFPLLAFALAGGAAQSAGVVDYASLAPPGQATEGTTLWDSVWLMLAPALILGYCTVSLSWISKLLEFDADLFACRLNARNGVITQESADRYAAMLERLAVVAGTPRQRRTWLHPSLHERIELVRTLPTEVVAARQVEKQLRLTVVVFLLMGAAPLAAAAWFAIG